MRKISPEEIRHVLATDGPTRYSHFVKQVADAEQVWGLRTPDGWVAMGDDEGSSMFPVWPHAEYAQLLAMDDWSNAVPTAIDVEDFVEEWLANLADEGDKVAVFPTPGGKGVPVDPLELQAHLREELARYE